MFSIVNHIAKWLHIIWFTIRPSAFSMSSTSKTTDLLSKKTILLNIFLQFIWKWQPFLCFIKNTIANWKNLVLSWQRIRKRHHTFRKSILKKLGWLTILRWCYVLYMQNALENECCVCCYCFAYVYNNIHNTHISYTYICIFATITIIRVVDIGNVVIPSHSFEFYE